MAKSPAGLDELFKGRHFEREIIVLCVRWYLRYKLSFRDLVEMMAERGLSLAHTTIMRWVQRFAPEFERRWNRFARQAGQSWRVDETYIKIRGVWTYLYRAVDREGRTVDFRLSGLWCKCLIWLMLGYVAIVFHAARTASHISGAFLV